MGKSKDLATGASYVDTAGDTMSGTLNVNGGNFYLAEDNAAAHRYMYLNTATSNDGHIILQRALANKHQLTTKPDGSFNIYGYAASGDVFNIDSSGRVLKPYQPCFHARRTGGHGTTGTIIFNTADINVGNHYSTSTGNFTAPISSRYLLYTNVLSNNSTSVGADLKINGTRYAVTEESWTDNNYRSTSIKVIASLSANDAVRVENKQGGYYGTNHYTFFGGYLLG